VQKVAHPLEFVCDVRPDSGSVVERRHGAVSLSRGPRHVQRAHELTGTESLSSFAAAAGSR